MDPFDNLLNLEEQYYQEGYDLGIADGSRAGRIEGRIFGLEKGFEKYTAMGQLAGRAAVWNARISPGPSPQSTSSVMALHENARMQRHVKRLKDLTDVETVPTENNEDAVSDFDDRLKDAQAKATLISRMTGESGSASSDVLENDGAFKAPSKALRVRRDETGKPTGEMEDFAGLPRVRKETT